MVLAVQHVVFAAGDDDQVSVVRVTARELDVHLVVVSDFAGDETRVDAVVNMHLLCSHVLLKQQERKDAPKRPPLTHIEIYSLN